MSGATTAQVVRRSADYLACRGVQSPQATAEALLMHLLQTDRAGLYSRRNGLDEATARLLGRALCQRCAGTPLQHLTGRQRFLELDLAVEPGVFVPRPETEVLVTEALAAVAGVPAPIVVDVGTGTGAIALAIKSRRPDAVVTATDGSPRAVSLARSNAVRLELEVDVRQGDLLSPVPVSFRGRVHLLVSNPPYVEPAEFDALPAEVKADPYEALVGGTDVHQKLSEAAPYWLVPDGWLAMEIGETQSPRVRSLLPSAWEVQVLPDLAARDRVVLARLRRR